MIVTILKTTFNKAKPKEITYRCYKNFDRRIFRENLKHELQNCESYTQYKSSFLKTLNGHAPLKKKIVRANEVPYMTKALRKAISNRSRLQHRYYKKKDEASLRAYRKQKNYCSRLYKIERKKYYINLDVNKITDNKTFWKTTKPFLSNKGASKNQITLIEGDEIIQDDGEIAKIMNDFFSKATESLNIDMPSELLNIEAITMDDIIENILLKYSNHPSIKLINENVKKGCFSFNIVNVSVIEKEVNALDGKKASMSDGIPPKILKENSCVCCEPLTKN